MPPALSPVLAADYVHELSADVRTVLVLDADGTVLAGPPAAAGAARALLAASDATELEAGTADVGVVAAARDEHHALVAVCGPFALGAVVRADLRAALAALRGAPPDTAAPPARAAADPADTVLREAAAAVLSAVQRA